MRHLLSVFFLFCISGMVFAQAPEGIKYQSVVRDVTGSIIADSPVTFRLSIIEGSAPGTTVYSEIHSLSTNTFGIANLVIGNGTVESGTFSAIDWAGNTHFLMVEVDPAGGTSYVNMGTAQLLSVPYALYAKNAGNQFSGDYNDLTNTPSLAGDVSGQIESNTVTGIQGMDISTNIPANGQVLKWNNILQLWEPSDDQLGAAGNPDGVVTGATFSGTDTKTMTLIRSNGLGDITATFTDLVDDADADPTNELQSLSISGNDLTISDGNIVTIPSNNYTAGAGINIDGSNQISNTAPDQSVTLTGSGATMVSGTYPNFVVSSTDNVNDADANPTNEIQTLTMNGNDLTISLGNTVTIPQNIYTAGSGILMTANTISNSAPDQTITIDNGTGINVTGSYPDFTINNTSPDQTVTITGNGATNVTGTYPNFIITSTDNNTTYSAGTGIGFTGTTINNTAPDQTVLLTGGGATNVSGTYPNYTVTSTDNNTTYNAGTGLTLTGTSFSANNTTAMWNANLLQGMEVSALAPIGGQILKYDGTNWVPATDANTTYTAGTGLTLTGTSFSHNAHSGDVTGTTALTVTGIQGHQVTSSTPGDNQILKWSTSNNRWELGEDQLGAAGTNDGVVTSVNVTGTTTKTITLTRSQSLSDLTATFTDEGSVYTAGSGINITGNTVTNTLPDQTVTLSGSGATSISGTYPNFTVSSTDNNTTYNAGTGITLSGTTFNAQTANALWNANQLQGVSVNTTTPSSGQVLKYNGTNWEPAADNNTSYTAGTGINITGTTVTNTAPDQTVTLTGSGATSVSGTYPSFTVSSTDNNTTYTAGTGLALTGTQFSSTQTLTQTLANGNSAGTYSINMNNQNITGANILGLRTSNAAYIDMRYGHIYDNNSSHGTDGQVLRVRGTSPNTYVRWEDATSLFTAGTGLSFSGNTLNTVWSVNGTHIYNNNAGNVGIGLNLPNARLTVKGNSTAPNTEPLFEVKNRAGQTVFIVYEDSVRVYVDDDPAKTNKGAFAVSGRNTVKAFTNNFLWVSPDSSRVWTGDQVAGFAVRDLNSTNKDSYMKITPNNYFIGHQSGNSLAGGMYNATLGYQAGKAITTGSENVFIGYQTGSLLATGTKNVFIGYQVMPTCTYANSNVYIGHRAGYASTGSLYNICMGIEAGYSNEGSDNVIIGSYAGHANKGNTNVMIGNNAGYSQTYGDYNTFIGLNSGYLSGYGRSNVCLGAESGYNIGDQQDNTFLGAEAGKNVTGSGNVCVGQQSGFSGGALTNTISIGKSTNPTASNSVRLGNSYITTLFCQGAYAATTSSNEPNMYVSSTGQIMRSTALTLNNVQGGTRTVGSNTSGVKVVVVTFSTNFVSLPKVVATPINESGINDIYTVTIRDISLSGFTALIYRVDSPGGGWGQNMTLNWQAWN